MLSGMNALNRFKIGDLTNGVYPGRWNSVNGPERIEESDL